MISAFFSVRQGIRCCFQTYLLNIPGQPGFLRISNIVLMVI